MPQLAILPNEVVYDTLVLCKGSASEYQETERSALWQMSLVDKWLRGMATPLLFQQLKKTTSDEAALRNSLFAIAKKPAILTAIRTLEVANEDEMERLGFYAARNFELLIYTLRNLPNLTHLRINLETVNGKRPIFTQTVFKEAMERVRLPTLKALIYTTTPPIAPTGIPSICPGIEALSIQVEHAPRETPGMMGLAGQLNLRAVELSKPTWSLDDVYEVEVVQILPSIRHLILVGELEGETTMADLVEVLAKLPNLEDFYLDESGQRKGFGHLDYREVLDDLADDNELSQDTPIATRLFIRCPNLETAPFPTMEEDEMGEDEWVNTNYVVDEDGYIAQIQDASYRPAINEFPCA